MQAACGDGGSGGGRGGRKGDNRRSGRDAGQCTRATAPREGGAGIAALRLTYKCHALPRYQHLVFPVATDAETARRICGPWKDTMMYGDQTG